MRASEIVTQLLVLLPQLTDKFTTNSVALSVTRAGTVLTIQCDKDHGLEKGNAVALSGAVEDLCFDRGLHRIGQLVPLTGEYFDAIVTVRIVRGGDDDAGVVPEVPGQPGHRGGGEDTAAMHAPARRLDTSRQGALDRGTRFACVPSDQNARVLRAGCE